MLSLMTRKTFIGLASSFENLKHNSRRNSRKFMRKYDESPRPTTVYIEPAVAILQASQTVIWLALWSTSRIKLTLFGRIFFYHQPESKIVLRTCINLFEYNDTMLNDFLLRSAEPME